MLRFTLIEIAVFLSPFAIFFLWRMLNAAAKARAAAEGAEEPPYAVLSIIGVALMVLTLIVFVTWTDLRVAEHNTYAPPRLENHELQPSRVDPARETGPGENAPPARERDDPGAA
jgi:hypothetical protein